MRIEVMSQSIFNRSMATEGITDRNVEDRKNEFFISICNTRGQNSQSFFHLDHKNVLRLFFDDVLPGDPEEGVVFFSEKHARKIHNFMKQFDFASTVMVHCAAGQCRSAAVGAFIAETFGVLDDNDSFKHMDVFMPNFHVLSLLRSSKDN